MDLDSWRLAIDRLYGFGCRVFSLTGGEPLIRSDIIDIVRHITQKRKAVCWMISNFGLMKKSTIDALAEAGMQFITCSLDSLQGHGEKSSSDAIELLSYAKSRGMIASTLTVITRENIDEVPFVMAHVQRRGIIFDMGLYQHVGGLFSPNITTCKVTDMAALEKLRKQMRSSKIRTGLVSPSWSYLTHDLSAYLDSSWKCSAEKDRFLVVNNNGTMMACQEHDTGVSIFNVETLDDSRWRAEKSRAVNACRGCFYGCYFQKERIGVLDALLDAWTMMRA